MSSLFVEGVVQSFVRVGGVELEASRQAQGSVRLRPVVAVNVPVTGIGAWSGVVGGWDCEMRFPASLKYVS